MINKARYPAATDWFQKYLRKGWNNIQHELLYISWGLMEIALFTPLLFSILGWARYWPQGLTTLWLLLIMFLPFNLARVLSILHLPKSRQQTMMAVALMLTVLLSIRTLVYAPHSLFDFSWIVDFFANIAEPANLLWLRDIGIFLLVVFMWWRGLRLVVRQFDIGQIGFRFRLGVLIAPLAIWFSHVGLTWNVTPFIMLYFLASLMAIALIRAEQLEQERSGFSISLSPRWLAYILAASTFIVLISGLLAAVISGESLFTIAVWLTPFLGALYAGGVVILDTMLYLGNPLISLISQFIDLLAKWLESLLATFNIDLATVPTIDISEVQPLATATDVVDVIAPPHINSKIMAVLLMTAVVLAVSLALGRLFRQATFAARESKQIDRLSWQEDRERGFAQRLLDNLGLWRRWRAAQSVRRIYRQMLKAAEESGYPRGDSDTPFEFLNTLAQMWPDNTADTRLITQAFVKVRYGELPETEEELASIDAAWRRLRDAVPAPIDQTIHLEKRLGYKDRSLS